MARVHISLQPAQGRTRLAGQGARGEVQGSWAVQVEKAGARSLKGPHTFVLERLLSVFWALVQAESDAPLSPEAEASADILCLISTLVRVRLLSQVRPGRLAAPQVQCWVGSCWQ